MGDKKISCNRYNPKAISQCWHPDWPKHFNKTDENGVLELEKTTQEAVETLKPFFKEAVHHEALKETKEYKHSSTQSLINETLALEECKNKKQISKEEIKKLITAGSFKPEKYNLRGMDFSGLDLSKISFNKCDLSGANFNGSKLRYTDFNFCKFSTLNGDKIEKASFENADISTSQFTYCDLREIDFEKSKIEPESIEKRRLLNFSDCNLQKASFKSQKFYDIAIQACDLRKADFSNAKFIKTNLSLSNLEEAKLQDIFVTRTNFRRSNLRNAEISFKSNPTMIACDMRASNWQYANYRTSQSIEFARSHLSGEDLTFLKHEPELWDKFDFTGADLEAANLSGLEIPASKLYKLGSQMTRVTNLRRANLAGAKFIGDEPGDTPKISKIDFSGANLSKVNFNQADFYGRINMIGANLSKAKLRGIFSGDDANCLDIRLADLRGVNLEKAHIHKWVSAGELHDKGLNLGKHGEVQDSPVIMGNYDGFDLRERVFDKGLSLNASFLGADLREAEFKSGLEIDSSSNFCFADLRGAKFPTVEEEGISLSSLDGSRAPCLGALYDKDENDKKKLPSIFNTTAFDRSLLNANLNTLRMQRTLAGYNLADRNFVFDFEAESGMPLKPFTINDFITKDFKDFLPRGKKPQDISKEEHKQAIEEYKKEYQKALEKYKNALRTVKTVRLAFHNLDIRNANFSNANLEGCAFQLALASGARFDCANLSNCNLDNADLADANFNYADMRNSRANGPFVNSDGVRLQATNQPPRRLMFNSIRSHNSHYAGGSYHLTQGTRVGG